MSRSFHVETIPAQGIRVIESPGDTFFVVQSAVVLQIRWFGVDFAEYAQGQGEDLKPAGASFKRLEIRNPTATPQNVVIYAGFSRFLDQRFAVIEPKTVFAPWTGTQLAATTGQAFSGVASGRQIRRKSIQVTNLDANLRLQLRDAAGNVGLSIFPETSITLPISEFVEVYNQNGTPLACNISEIWWSV